MTHRKYYLPILLLPLLLSACYLETRPSDCNMYDFGCSDTEHQPATQHVSATSATGTNAAKPVHKSTITGEQRVDYLEHRLRILEEELFQLKQQVKK